ncbi:hypothetical protein [Actinomadura sp. HBU206391]|uniref:hypothetical protein n=1 Tax=Actinomadura sp. HBU206391 TaxID=2731692 RepID=UPI00164F7DCD|nr:hypothetical protein [Actinomadura sp. HBU206391]MBC6457934.1 hypothetical protein [Actinomadura sp. HBU206391]
MTSQDQAATHPVWQREVTATRPHHRKPSPVRQAFSARLEELSFRSGVAMLVTAAGVLAIVGAGLGMALGEGAGGRLPGPQTVGSATGSSPSPSPTGPSASADPTRGVRVPPMAPATPEKAAAPPSSTVAKPRATPRSTERAARPDRPAWWQRPPHRRDRDRWPDRRRHDPPWWRHR